MSLYPKRRAQGGLELPLGLEQPGAALSTPAVSLENRGIPAWSVTVRLVLADLNTHRCPCLPGHTVLCLESPRQAQGTSTRKAHVHFGPFPFFLLLDPQGRALEFDCLTLMKFFSLSPASVLHVRNSILKILSFPPSAQFLIHSVVLRQLSVGTCHGSNFSYSLFWSHTHIFFSSSFYTKILHWSVLEPHGGPYYQKLWQSQ